MADQEICRKCSQRNGCRQVYQQMADKKGPSVLGKVLNAFALPLVSFVLAVAVFSRLTVRITSLRSAAALLTFMVAIGITVLIVVATKAVNRRFGKNRQN